MPRRPDPFDNMPDEERTKLMRDTVKSILGPKVGDELWKHMEPAMRDRRRQLGDAPEPEKNFWGGVWRVYEAE